MILSDFKNADLGNKRVLVRVDFNVEFFKDGKPKEKYKIESAKNTINFLLEKPGIKIALLSHLGRPENREKEFSFRNYYKELGKILGIELVFVEDCIGEEVKTALGGLKIGQVLMLENVRFYKEDTGGDIEFAKKLTENFDVYINEAFGASHRDHSSITKITQILPFFAGFNLQKEVEKLEKVREKFERPALALIGGAKIETKLPVIKFFAEKYNKVLVGGKLGLETEKEKIFFPQNVLTPLDYTGGGMDIGPQTVGRFKREIVGAKTIVWNGPLGKFEEPPYDKGTSEILNEIIKNKNAYKVAGGGETIQVLEEKNLIGEFDFISTGGGAMLEFLAKGTLPGIEALIIKNH